ncbi:MAG: hypothetical protein WKF79_09045 [Nocardioides sp.]
MKLLERPPGLFFHVLLVAPVLLGLWGASYVGGALGWGLVAFVGVGLMGLAWVVRVVTAVAMTRRWSWWFVMAPVLGGVAIGLVAVDAPLRARFAASQDAFERAIQEGRAIEDQRLGLYEVREIAQGPGGCTLAYDDVGSFLGRAGFALCPDGVPQQDVDNFGPMDFEHLAGDWYTFTTADF